MRARQPMTQTMKASDVRQHFASVLNRVFRREARIVVEKSGIPVAAIVSVEDLKRLDQLDQLDRARAERFRVIDELRAAFAGVPDEELEREADRALAEVRAEMGTERAPAAAER